MGVQTPLIMRPFHRHIFARQVLWSDSWGAGSSNSASYCSCNADRHNRNGCRVGRGTRFCVHQRPKAKESFCLKAWKFFTSPIWVLRLLICSARQKCLPWTCFPASLAPYALAMTRKPTECSLQTCLLEPLDNSEQLLNFTCSKPIHLALFLTCTQVADPFHRSAKIANREVSTTHGKVIDVSRPCNFGKPWSSTLIVATGTS